MTVVNATVRKPTSGTPWAYAEVKVGILGSGVQSGGIVTAGVAHQATASDGTVSFDLPANNPGELYAWTNPDGTVLTFRVPSGAGPFTLDALLVTTSFAAGQIGVTQDALTSALAALASTYVAGRACSLVGFNSLPAPTGVGLEFVIDSGGLEDIRYNGVSL